ncbi:hypothetical protein ID866_4472 [Astraeus odoratus]|nr:hypothetical protein ID866_4472 [Astraeus odoratus]
MSATVPATTSGTALPAVPKKPPYTVPLSEKRSQLVTDKQLEGHLALLRAFHSLRQTVQAGNDKFPAAAKKLDAEKRWTWFVSLAVERYVGPCWPLHPIVLLPGPGARTRLTRSKHVLRFERWCKAIAIPDTEWNSLPPIDVAMVWHAYMLNPIWYAEDTLRIPILATLRKYNDSMEICLEHPEFLTTDAPPTERTETWYKRTNTPYNPLEAAASASLSPGNLVRLLFDVVGTEFLRETKDGYAQTGFKTRCLCGFEITRDKLGMYKLIKNFVEQEAPQGYLAGTLNTPQDANDTAHAMRIKEVIMLAWTRMGAAAIKAEKAKGNTAGKAPVPTAKEIMAAAQFDPSKFRAGLSQSVKGKFLERVLGAYTNDRMFSIDLVGAVLRQGSFVDKMHGLGWTKPDFFDSDNAVVLRHCITRYHAFLKLMADTSGSFFVPTLDIDLAWHTHQLTAHQYHEDCLELIGRYVDHDDKVEEGVLSTSFDVTCRVWQERYGVPYMYCGCPPPGETLGQRIRRTLSIAHLKDKPATVDASLIPPEDTSARAATHPSDHNALPIMGQRAREKRMKQFRERRAKEEKRLAKEGDKKTKTTFEQLDHQPAFLAPVPLPNSYSAPAATGGITYTPDIAACPVLRVVVAVVALTTTAMAVGRAVAVAVELITPAAIVVTTTVDAGVIAVDVAAVAAVDVVGVAAVDVAAVADGDR